MHLAALVSLGSELPSAPQHKLLIRDCLNVGSRH